MSSITYDVTIKQKMQHKYGTSEEKEVVATNVMLGTVRQMLAEASDELHNYDLDIQVKVRT